MLNAPFDTLLGFSQAAFGLVLVLPILFGTVSFVFVVCCASVKKPVITRLFLRGAVLR
jgi:hypothetical protein